MYKYEESKLKSYCTDQFINMVADHCGYIAGGALTAIFSDQKINDIDIYFLTKEDFDKFYEKASSLDSPNPEELYFIKTFRSQNAISFKVGVDYRESLYTRWIKVQLIQKYVGSPSEVIKKFDFTICMASFYPGFTSENWYLDDRFLPDLAAKRLVYTSTSDYQISSLHRLGKYYDRGFRAPASSLIKLAFKIHSTELKTYADLKDQLEGLDTIIFGDMIHEENLNERFDMSEAIQMIDKYMEKYMNKLEHDNP